MAEEDFDFSGYLKRKEGLFFKQSFHAIKGNFLLQYASSANLNKTTSVVDISEATFESCEGTEFAIKTKSRKRIVFQASTPVEKDSWLNMLKQVSNFTEGSLLPSPSSRSSSLSRFSSLSLSSSPFSPGGGASSNPASPILSSPLSSSSPVSSTTSPRSSLVPGRDYDGVSITGRQANQPAESSSYSIDLSEATAPEGTAIVMANTLGLIVDFNECATEIFGYSQMEAIGKSVSILMPEPFRSQHDGFMFRHEKYGTTNLLGKPRTLKGQRKNGEIFPINISLYKSMGIFVVWAQDLSQHDPADSYFRSSKSVSLSLIEGQNLTKKKKSVACIFSLDDKLLGRSFTEWHKKTQAWGQQFTFQDLPIETERIKIEIIHKPSFGSIGEALGTCILNLPKPTDRQAPQWFPALMEDEVQDPKLFVEMKVSEVDIFPLADYSDFLQLLLQDIGLCKALAKSYGAGGKVEEVAKLFLMVYILKNRSTDFIQSLVMDEVMSTDDFGVMFRGNSLATKAFDLYMKMLGAGYLNSTIQPQLKIVYEEKENCEIDPAKIDKPELLERNQERLLAHVRSFWKAISDSSPKIPMEFRQIFQSINQTVSEKFDDENLKYSAISGFLFLRFFCPAIMHPVLFSVMDDAAPNNGGRTLTLVAKTLQNLANLVEFGSKEPFMACLNKFITENTKNMKLFIDNISRPRVGENYSASIFAELAQNDLAWQLASLRQHFNQQRAILEQQASSQPISNDYAKLFAILDDLNQKEKEYKPAQGS